MYKTFGIMRSDVVIKNKLGSSSFLSYAKIKI